MIDPNPLTPGYDLALEVLCCLTPVCVESAACSAPDDKPYGTPLSELAIDFDLDSQHKVREVLNQIKQRFRIATVTFRRPGHGNCAGIAKQHWPRANDIAAEYWQRVHARSSRAGAA